MNIIKYYLRKYKHLVCNKFLIIRQQVIFSRKKAQEYPNTIQLPITHLCNFDCVMCGMHHMINRTDFSIDELKKILSDKLFSKIEAVGVNGGEPFLRKDIVECFKMMSETLPYLKDFYVISNGYFTSKILSSLKEIKKTCNQKGIKLNISFSVDGIYDMQDFHRGHADAFKNVNNTIDSILSNKSAYVDNLNIICTITKHNIYRINEVDIWARSKGIDVAYNIATVNERIENLDREESFSIFSDEHARMMAQEFFYQKYRETNSKRYFAIFLFLKTGKRYDTCPCMFNEWVTVTPDSQVAFCATHSKSLGSGLYESPYSLVHNNQTYLKQLIAEHCYNCSHYMYNLNADGLKEYLKDRFNNEFMR